MVTSNWTMFVEETCVHMLSEKMRNGGEERERREREGERNYYTIEFFHFRATGGELFRLIAKDPLPEDKAREVVYQILDGVKHLHSLNIVHLDLKVSKRGGERETEKEKERERNGRKCVPTVTLCECVYVKSMCVRVHVKSVCVSE